MTTETLADDPSMACFHTNIHSHPRKYASCRPFLSAQTTSGNRHSRRALSLIEILVAFTLLAIIGMGLIQALRGSGASGEAFSAEHFTAMFLAQKVIEDINCRISDNPHFFSQLIASATGDFQRVVDGESFFFKLLENTTNPSLLLPEEDRPITAEQTAEYQQLKNFSCRVSSRFVPNPATGESFANLTEVEVTISWNDRQSMPREYSLKQKICGVNRDELGKITEDTMRPFPASAIAWALFEFVDPTYADERTIPAFLALNGGDRAVVEALGRVLLFTYLAEDTLLTYDQLLDDLESKRNEAMSEKNDGIAATSFQEQIAATLEQKASVLFLYAARTSNAINFLSKQTSLDDDVIGAKLDALSDELRGRMWIALEHFLVIPLNFHGAENGYLDLLAAPFISSFPPRRLTPMLRRLTDLRKIGLFFANVENKGLDNKMVMYRQGLTDLRQQFLGRQPYFVDYLDTELAMAKSIDVLTRAYGGDAGLTGVIQRIVSNQELFLEIEGKISGGGGPFALPSSILGEVPITIVPTPDLTKPSTP